MAAGQCRNGLFGDWFPLAAKIFQDCVDLHTRLRSAGLCIFRIGRAIKREGELAATFPFRTDLFRHRPWMRLSTTRPRRCEEPRWIPLLPEINVGL